MHDDDTYDVEFWNAAVGGWDILTPQLPTQAEADREARRQSRLGWTVRVVTHRNRWQ